MNDKDKAAMTKFGTAVSGYSYTTSLNTEPTIAPTPRTVSKQPIRIVEILSELRDLAFLA